MTRRLRWNLSVFALAISLSLMVCALAETVMR